MATHELTLTRLLDPPADKLFRCWTDQALLMQWFAPKPYAVSDAELDVRPGGANKVTMRAPDGQDTPFPGQYLEVVPNRKIVFSDCFTGDWKPKDGPPFMVATITFEPEGGKTRYSASVRHWSAEECKRHEEMGFHQGWGLCADQLEALAKTI